MAARHNVQLKAELANVHKPVWRFRSGAVPSPRGGFGGSIPPKWNMKHYKSVEISSIFRVSRPPAQTQNLLIENFLATVLARQRPAFIRAQNKTQQIYGVFCNMSLWLGWSYTSENDIICGTAVQWRAGSIPRVVVWWSLH